jgi:hypothetical protein
VEGTIKNLQTQKISLSGDIAEITTFLYLSKSVLYGVRKII